MFYLDDDDLYEAENPSGEAYARLDFTVDGEIATGSAQIQARADGSVPVFECGTDFSFEQSIALRVLK